MGNMPRPRKPFVHREVTRHGVTVWYFRKGKGARIRLRGDYESPEWRDDYEVALSGAPRLAREPRTASGTLGWLIARYFDSAAFAGLAEGTKRQRRSILMRVAAGPAGEWRITQVTSKKIAEGRDGRSSTPMAAVHFVKTTRALFKWAVGAQLAESNPAAAVTYTTPRTDGHHTWTLDEVRQFQDRHPLGTRARLALDILLYTGMRRSDAVLLGRQHIRDGWIFYRSGKTRMQLTIPLLQPLARSIEAAPIGDMALLTLESGKPFGSAEVFGNWFRERCIEARVPGRAHGLRKAGATFAAENGASDLMLMAMWGWTDARQAGVYTRRASRARLAEQAGRLLTLDEGGTSIPAPDVPVRGAGEKS